MISTQGLLPDLSMIQRVLVHVQLRARDRNRDVCLDPILYMASNRLAG